MRDVCIVCKGQLSTDPRHDCVQWETKTAQAPVLGRQQMPCSVSQIPAHLLLDRDTVLSLSLGLVFLPLEGCVGTSLSIE